MSYIKYFPQVDQFSQLIKLYRAAPTQEREPLMQKIQASPFLQQWNQEQERFQLDVLAQWENGRPVIGLAPWSEEKIEYKTQGLRHDFFLSMAVPGACNPSPREQEQLPYHRHNYLELIFVSKGHYVQYISGVRHEHRMGDFCLMNPNVVHRDLISGPEDEVLFFCLAQSFVYFDLMRAFAPHPQLKEFMSDRLNNNFKQFVLFHPLEPDAVNAVVEQILQENLEKRPGHHLVIHGLLVRLFSLLVRQGSYSVCEQNPTRRDEYLTAEIIEYIRSHLQDVTRQQVAVYFHFNPDYLNRLLKKTVGKRYSQYVHDLRLESAANRLLHSQASVNDIIRECGYVNKGYFNRLFRQKFGKLPGEYRKLYGRNDE